MPPSYKPGGEARIRFHVTNSHGEGVRAALGLQVVDEAVFALAEKQPGFAKVFFYLEAGGHEAALRDPLHRHVRHRRSRSRMRKPTSTTAPLALSSPRPKWSTSTSFDTEFGRTIPQAKYAEYTGRYQAAYTAQVRRLATQLSRAYNRIPSTSTCQALLLTSPTARTARRLGHRASSSTRSIGIGLWQDPLLLRPERWRRSAIRYRRRPRRLCRSSLRQLSPGIPVAGAGTIDIQTEHDRGPFNGHAEITGSVKDQSGAVIPGATINLRRSPTAKPSPP